MSSLIDTPATRWPNLLFILAFSLVLMQQFWVFGKMPLLFFLFYAIAAYALTKGYLIINKSALIYYMIIVICALSSTIVVWQHTGYKELTSLRWTRICSPARYSTRALPDTSQWNGIFGTLLFFSILGHRTDH